MLMPDLVIMLTKTIIRTLTLTQTPIITAIKILILIKIQILMFLLLIAQDLTLMPTKIPGLEQIQTVTKTPILITRVVVLETKTLVVKAAAPGTKALLGTRMLAAIKVEILKQVLTIAETLLLL